MEKWGTWGLKRPKNMVLIGNKAMGGGGGIGESSRGKMGRNGGKWGKMGGNGEKGGKMGKPTQSTLAPHFLLFAPTSPHNTPFPHISPPFPPHCPPFSPIPPHFPWYWVHYGYVAGYSTPHLVRVFLRPLNTSLPSAPPKQYPKAL